MCTGGWWLVWLVVEYKYSSVKRMYVIESIIYLYSEYIFAYWSTPVFLIFYDLRLQQWVGYPNQFYQG